jgi:Uma2 family endonuclease
MHRPTPENISLADFLIWENDQAERHEWIDGAIVRCEGVSAPHSIITTNISALFHAAVADTPCVVQSEARRLVPRDRENNDLGSFYADVFLTCTPEDLAGRSAHFPTVVVEVLSRRLGEEFRDKKQAYLNSARLIDYILIDSRKRSTTRFSWKTDADTGQRRLFVCEQRRGPLGVPALGLSIPFEQIYAKTNVPSIVHPVASDREDETEIVFD